MLATVKSVAFVARNFQVDLGVGSFGILTMHSVRRSQLSSESCHWKLRNLDDSITVDATVPGQVQLDLMRHGIIQDPYVNYNDTLWVGTSDWIYSTEFHVSEVSGLYFLECKGLDTICTIKLNGQEIASTDNQFVKYIFPVSVISGKNSVEFHFKNPVDWATSKSVSYPYPVPDGFAIEQNGERNRNFIRKEQCSFSWDWGPCCLPVGISGDLQLINLLNSPYVTDWTVDISLIDSEFVVDVRFWVIMHGIDSCWIVLKIDEISYSCNILCTRDTAHKRFVIPFEKVSLWYPHGYGSQKTYKIHAILTEPSEFSSIVYGRIEKNIGFRSAQLIQEKYLDGRPGSSFFFRVNGIDIFAKGTNWIPADAFESRVTKEKIRNFLISCKEANMNMIRVWGGGIYQQDCFYDICDELGIMVWQEFMFACAMYPVDEIFLDSVKKEVRYQVKRLMSHPCIILWSGNNENEEALVNGWYEETKKNPFIYTIDYSRLYHETIMASILELDQTRQFISSSPSNGMISSAPFTERFISETGSNDDFGDVHYYNYKDNGTDVSKFRCPRFASEYGFQSMPSFSSIKDICSRSDWHPLSTFWIQRNHHKNGMQEIMSQISHFFTLPDFEGDAMHEKQFNDFCYLSQLSQAICVKAQTEHYRRLKSASSNCMGALYWQCNDIWQAPTWSSIEYNGNWKPLHYFVKDFFSPVWVSMFENQDYCEIHVSNDGLEPVQGIVTIDFITYKNHNRKSIAVPFDVLTNDSKCIHQFPSFTEIIKKMGLERREFFVFVSCNIVSSKSADHKLKDEWEIVSSVDTIDNVWYPSCFESVQLFDPKIIVSEMKLIDSGTVIFRVDSSAVALFVWLESHISGRFSKNAFLLLPGQSVVIKFKCWTRIDSLNCFEQKLTIRSLWDSKK